MAHNIEVSVDGFEAAFASRKHPAWHLLGTTFEEDVNTREMLKLSHLADWDVHLVPISVPGVSEDRIAKSAYATVRTNPFDGELDSLGIVGKNYKIFQNEELLSFGDTLLDGGGRWETAGSIKGGRQIFASIAFPDEIVLDPNGRDDHVKKYLMLTTSHDGSISVVAANTPVRVVCQNTLNYALRGATQQFKIRHTESMDGKVMEARRVLGISFNYFDNFQHEAEKLISTEMTIKEFWDIVNDLYPKPEYENKNALTRWESRWETLSENFVGGSTNENIVGTAWGGLNTLTEHSQWFRKPRKNNAESLVSAGSGFDALTNSERTRIHSRFLDFVGA